MSELPDLQFELPRPAPPSSWRERLAALAESFDVTPGRLVGGVVALLVLGVLGWKLLAPPASPPEMQLPYVSTSVPGAAPVAPGVTGVTGAGVGAPPGEVVVHVAGAVTAPGVQRLPNGARVVDAVAAAGGGLPDADLARVNLAAPLSDGQQIYVPAHGEVPPVPVGGAPPSSSGSGGGGAGGAATMPGQSGGMIDLNRASLQELETLPGIGPATAQAIVDYRTQNGRFSSVEQLLEVRGIGEAKLEQIRSRATV